MQQSFVKGIISKDDGQILKLERRSHPIIRWLKSFPDILLTMRRR
jgi:hypothetical protein